MFKQFVAIVGWLLLTGQLFAVPPDNAIFMSRLKVTGVQEFNPNEDIVKFTTHSSGGWEYLMAHSSSSSGDILKDSLAGIELKGFDPGIAIESFTTSGPIDGWVSLIAHAGIQSDTILKTSWAGTWVQGYSDGSNVVKGFTADSSGDSVWLEVVMGPAGIEEDSNCQLSISNYQLAIYPNPSTAGVRVKWSGISEKQKISLQIYDLSGRLVKTLTPNPLSLTTAVEWDGVDDSGRKVATGVYFLRLKAGDFEQMRKLVVVH